MNATCRGIIPVVHQTVEQKTGFTFFPVQATVSMFVDVSQKL